MPADDLTFTTADGTVLVGERRGARGGVPVVLLHAVIADRRSWHGVLDRLEAQGGLDLLAYDRRGFGDSPDPADGAAFTHLDDLVDVLDGARIDRAVLVGSSMGGALALDLALTRPERVAGLVLLGTAVSGMTDEGEEIDWSPDPTTGALLEQAEAAERAGDVEEQVRLELHLWLDGPTQPEGRVGGAARTLAADMDRRAIAGGARDAGDAGLDAWHALRSIGAPGVCAWGELDMPPDQPFSAVAADRLPAVRPVVLPGVAHLPSLERPEVVADLVREVALPGGAA